MVRRPGQCVAFLDRDGTINRIYGDGPIYEIDRFELLPRAAMAIALLNQASIPVVVVTNQGGIGHVDRDFDWDRYRAIESKMVGLLAAHSAHVDHVFVCPHPDYERCGCRKPATGMFDAACNLVQCSPSESYIIGDSAADIEAGKRFGLQTIWVRTGNALTSDCQLYKPDREADDLYEAVQVVLRNLGQ